MWYHYYDAHEVFNSIRCYIAAYVWMTGFGEEKKLALHPTNYELMVMNL